MAVFVPVVQLRNCLRAHGFTFKKQGDKADIWRKKGGVQRVGIPRRDLIPEAYVRLVLRQVGLSQPEIEQFFRDAETACNN